MVARGVPSERGRLHAVRAPDTLAVAGEARGCSVLESVFHRSRAMAGLRARPAGHFHRERTHDEFRSADVATPVAGGWPVLEIDTSQPIRLESLWCVGSTQPWRRLSSTSAPLRPHPGGRSAGAGTTGLFAGLSGRRAWSDRRVSHDRVRTQLLEALDAQRRHIL